ncbi:helicase [Entamoeba histolytica HM-3:IMSS]|uniref:Helicase n=1 Tax=Entamoeba histolytica HM-3:IMSS TaxID=885315 RepID=M7W2Q0_ENTHI|nr:helicase [Entamoeba histolytica HM-3:IMSS]
MTDKKQLLNIPSQRGIIRIPPPSQRGSTQTIHRSSVENKTISSQTNSTFKTPTKSDDFNIDATLALFDNEKQQTKIPTPITISQRKSTEKNPILTHTASSHKIISIPKASQVQLNQRHNTQTLQKQLSHTTVVIPSKPSPVITPIKTTPNKGLNHTTQFSSQKTIVIKPTGSSQKISQPQQQVECKTKCIEEENFSLSHQTTPTLIPSASASSSVVIQQKSSSSTLPAKSNLHERGWRVGMTNVVFTGEGDNEVHLNFSSNRFMDVKEQFKESHINFELLGKEKKEMKISFKDYQSALDICRKRPLLTCEPITKCVRDLLVLDGKEEQGDLDRYESIPSKLRNTMFEYQRIGVQFGLRKKGRLLIGDEMGLGKTLQALALVSAYPENEHILVITPNSLVYQWCDQIQRWLDVDPNDIAIYKPKDIEVPNTRFVVISYNSMANTQGNMFSHAFPMVICDECHFIKTDSSKRSKETLDVCKKAKQVIFLSGTPALSRPMELYNILSVLIKDIGTKESFGKRYCEETGTRYKNYLSMKNEKELKYLLTTVMIRRLKHDVLKELPPKIREKVYLGELDKNEYRECLEKMKKDLDNARGVKQKRQQVFELHRSTGLAKIPLIQAYLDDVLDSGIKKVVVFAHHRDVLDGIVYNLQRKKVQFIRIDGETKSENKKELVDIFRDDDNCRVAVLSILAANCGLEFQKAALCIFAEMTFVPGEMLQAEDRIHRIGQQADSVKIEYLIANKSYDEQIWNTIEKKLDVVGKVLDGKSRELDHCTKEVDIGEEEMGEFVKGMMEVIKSYDERKKLREEEEDRIEKRKLGKEELVQNKDLQNEIDLLDDIGDDKTCSKSLSKFSKFQFEKK